MAGMPQTLSGRDYMRGPGVDTSGAAIQLPATAPLGPTAAVNGVGNSPAMQVPAVAGMGTAAMVDPAAPSGGMSQGATAGGIGRFLFGSPAIDAAAAANTQADRGNMAQALGSGVRAAGAAALHPYQVAGGLISSVGHAAAGAVNDFASGLLGGSPAAAAPAPVVAAPAPRVVPAGIPAVLNEEQAAAVRQRFGFMQPQAPAATAQQPTAAAPQQSQMERELGLEAGTVAKTLHDAPPSKRPELIQLYAGLRGAAQTNAVRGQYIGMVNDKYHGAMAAAGNDVTKQAAARAEMMEHLLSITSPQAFSAGYMPGALQQQ